MRNIARLARKRAVGRYAVGFCRFLAFVLLLACVPVQARLFIDTEHHFKVIAPDNLALCTNHLFGGLGPNHGPQIFLDVGAGAKCPDISSWRSVGVYAYYTVNEPQTLKRLVAETCSEKRVCTPVSDPTLTFPGLKSKAVRFKGPGGTIEIDVMAITKHDVPLDLNAILITPQAFLARDLESFRRILATVRVLPGREWCESTEPRPWSESETEIVFEDCVVDMLSADGKLVLHVGRDGRLAVRSASGSRALAVEPGAAKLRAFFRWSPTAHMFTEAHVVEGRLVLQVYRQQGERFVNDAAFEKEAVRLYKAGNRCGGIAGDPDIWALGWSADGKAVDVAIERPENQPCAGAPARTAMRMAVDGGAIMHVYSAQEILERFPGW